MNFQTSSVVVLRSRTEPTCMNSSSGTAAFGVVSFSFACIRGHNRVREQLAVKVSTNTAEKSVVCCQLCLLYFLIHLSCED